MRISLGLALVLCVVVPALTKPPAETAFDEWLAAFNRNERAALTEFNARRFGEPEHNIEYLLDSREETKNRGQRAILCASGDLCGKGRAGG